MKKILLSICAFISLQANAQVIWQQDFSTATTPGLPTGWLQINVDGLTPNANVAAFNFGTNAWVTRDYTTSLPTYGKVAASTSWYNPVGQSNDWLISPQFVPLAGSFLEWEAYALDAQYQDGYLVKLSTNGGSTVADFNITLATVTAENSSFTKRATDIGAYAGQNVRVAFVNNSNDKFVLLLDNIKALVPTPKDMSVTGVNITRYTVAGSSTISGTVKNNGGIPVTQMVLNYQVGTNPSVAQTFPLPPLGYTSSTNYSFTAPAALAVGEQNVKVWVSSVNASGADPVPANDTAKTFSYVASQTETRNALIEEFTSSTCPPCKTLNATFDPLLNSNGPNTAGRVNVVKYQMNYPSPGNDGSYNENSRVRHDFYGVSGIPTTILNGRFSMNAHDQAEIDAGKADPAFAKISGTISRTGNNVTASSTVVPYITVTQNSPIRVQQILLQQFYKNPGNTTGQTDYYHVQRDMNPNGVGASVPTMTSGTPLNFTFNKNFNSVAAAAQLSTDLWNSNNNYMEYVVFLQDTVSGHVLQSFGVQSAPTGIVNLDNGQTIGVYPNPANTNATLAIKTDNEAMVDVKVLDLTGKVVYATTQSKLKAGNNEITFNTTNFVNGVYNVIVSADDKRFTTKLVIAH
jgi:thiol-disulfide isomerase/thioredoxin